MIESPQNTNLPYKSHTNPLIIILYLLNFLNCDNFLSLFLFSHVNVSIVAFALGGEFAVSVEVFFPDLFYYEVFLGIRHFFDILSLYIH